MDNDGIRIPPDALERMERRVQVLEEGLRKRIEAGEARDARAYAQGWAIALGVLRVVQEVYAEESPALWRVQAVSLILEGFAEDKSRLVGFEDD